MKKGEKTMESRGKETFVEKLPIEEAIIGYELNPGLKDLYVENLTIRFLPLKLIFST